jgi:hypothetical protein
MRERTWTQVDNPLEIDSFTYLGPTTTLLGHVTGMPETSTEMLNGISWNKNISYEIWI